MRVGRKHSPHEVEVRFAVRDRMPFGSNGGEFLGFAESWADHTAMASTELDEGLEFWTQEASERKRPNVWPLWIFERSRPAPAPFSFRPFIRGLLEFRFGRILPSAGSDFCGKPSPALSEGWFGGNRGVPAQDRGRSHDLVPVLPACVWVSSSIAARREVQGKENIPATGPFILVANHQGFLDPFIVQVSAAGPFTPWPRAPSSPELHGVVHA